MFKNLITGCLLVLSLFACTKDELTQPVQTELVLGIMHPDEDEKKSLIDVEGGRFRIGEITFNGNRENGENYSFSRELPATTAVNFSKTHPGSIMKFEMPQGVYTGIDIEISLSSVKSPPPVGESIERSALQGGVELWGTYLDTHEKSIPYVFLYTVQDAFSFKATAADGTEKIVVKDKNSYKAVLELNPQHWMELINARMLQSAKHTLVDGIPTIIISESQNTHIYKLLANRIEKSALLNID